ncbi:salicylate carboxymethyltransferase-like protein [Cinnamomum micranthum f. kanehirae]|uniref:Salicylate carboxymethyltransferase-like protein n=1 Tax=Cinnamomum micranthum f. kanehirae TaxID=337451 RepID=A0A443P6F1_9MAGN|nr:salicylate carboxymethyltransferase-like protein [Cinnamomum micranthum f. kanehirae]
MAFVVAILECVLVDMRIAICKSRPVVQDCILDLYCTNFPEILNNMADFVSSSGPNALLVIGEIIDAIQERCHQLRRHMPELRMLLNDLPGNDFNTIFRFLTS